MDFDAACSLVNSISRHLQEGSAARVRLVQGEVRPRAEARRTRCWFSTRGAALSTQHLGGGGERRGDEGEVWAGAERGPSRPQASRQGTWTQPGLGRCANAGLGTAQVNGGLPCCQTQPAAAISPTPTTFSSPTSSGNDDTAGIFNPSAVALHVSVPSHSVHSGLASQRQPGSIRRWPVAPLDGQAPGPWLRPS